MRWEETLLESRLGQAYRDYAARVPRWIPPSFNRGDRNLRRATLTAFSWRATLFSERGTFVAMAAGLLAAVDKGSFLSVCHRYHEATERYGRHASPIFSTRFASGRLRRRYSR